MRIEEKLQGPRIALRNYEAGDLAFVSSLWFDKENGKYMSDPEEAYIDEAYRQALADMAEDADGSYFVAVERESGKPLGTCCAFPEKDDEGKITYDIGYCVHKSQWRKGYGSEIVALLLDWLKTLGAQQVTAEVAKENAGSVGLLRKFGFQVLRETSFKKYNMDVSFESFIFGLTLQ